MPRNSRSIDATIPFSESVDQTRVPAPNGFIIERHRPTLFDTPFHHHTSVEVNFLQDCSMKYSFSGRTAHLDANRLVVFWGAAPHRVTDVVGEGRITNIYLTLGQFVRWGLPSELVKAILSGEVIASAKPDPIDALLIDRLYNERQRDAASWRRTHLAEIECRLRRLALDGWSTLLSTPRQATPFSARSATMRQVEAMLRFISDNFTLPISVEDIAEASSLSPARAGRIFRDVMTVSIKKHLTRARLSHARMLLIETEAKVATVALDSGFASLSAFYEAFTKEHGQSPAKFRRQSQRSNPFLAFHRQA
jgi:AraC-like DNA-binding protein